MATIVLVHGHMHGAWCWGRVVPLLEARGHRVVAFDLPGRGADARPHAEVTLEDFVAATAAVVQAEREPVVLVGHSAGGTVLSEIAERLPERVALLVYVAAILLRDGESIFSAFVPIAPQDGAIAADGGSAVITDRALLRRRFYNTCSDVDAAWALDRVCPEPLAPMMAPVRVTPARFGRVKRAFIKTAQDRGVFPADQDRMSAGCDPVIAMDTDHSPFLSAPEEFAAHLDALARR
ncbi:MAG: alpha/beta fold hydrolase [Rhizomicrobium sp.]